MSIEIRVHGHETLARRFENVHARMRILEQTVIDHEDIINRGVRPRTPARTYRLRGSWESGRPITHGTRFIGVMGSPVFYAHMVERGVRGKPGKRMLETAIKNTRHAGEALWRGALPRIMQGS